MMLQDITEDLFRHREDSQVLADGIHLRRQIVPQLDRYDRAGWLVASWSQESILAGCRRLMDDDRRSRSLVNTLKRLAPMKLCATTLSTHWQTLSRQVTGGTRNEVAQRLIDELNGPARQAGLGLAEKAVRQVADKLVADYADIKEAASKSVAHDDAGHSLVLNIERVESFAKEVVTVALRWAKLTGGVEVRPAPTHVGGAEMLSHALRTFHVEKYVQARSRARRTGMTREAADAAVEASYRTTTS